MSTSLILGCLWVIAATVVAMMPMRRQYVPGLILLVLAPILIGVIGWEHGVWWAVGGLAAFVSMFRNPLKYMWKKARGQNPQLPKELRK